MAEERFLARGVLRRLADEFAPRATIDPIFWEHEPLLATDTFQTQIVRPSETDIVICILWSRLGTRLPQQISRPDGSRYGSGTEFEFEDAVGARRLKGSPDLIVYRKMAAPLVSLQDDKALEDRRAQKRALDEFVNRWFHDSAEGTLIAAFHPFDSSAEFEERLEEHLRKLVQRRLPAAAPGGERTRVTWTAGSPFRGLDTFEFEHAPVFFGRTKAVGDVLGALRLQAAAGRPFVLILGASGSGKSSLARAGVLPLLTQPGVVEGVGAWRRAVLRPGDSPSGPFVSLAAALLRPEALPELGGEHGADPRELATVLRESPAGAIALFRQALPRTARAQVPTPGATVAPHPAKLIIVLDQLEELFTIQTIAPAERAAFVGCISALVRSGQVWVVATLRNDFYARLAELPQLAELKEGAGQYDLALPTAAEVAQMIRRPALAAGLRFEEDAATGETLDDLLRDAAVASPESLPLLEFTLEELYKRRTADGLLTREAYREIGGLEGAIANRAEAVFASMAGDVQAAMPTVFRALVGVSSTSEAVTVRPALAEVVVPTPAAAALVRALVDARLLSADRAPDGTAVIGVTHEALLRRWPRLQEWSERDREFLRVRGRVQQAARRWLAEGRRADLLLPEGKPLDEATLLLEAMNEHLGDDDRAFVIASRALARDRRRRRRAAAVTLASLAALACVSAIVAIYANLGRRDAQLRLGQSENQRRAAELERRRADVDRHTAEVMLASGTLTEVDARAVEGRLDQSREALGRAVGLFRRVGRSTLPLELRLWQTDRLSPPPIMSLSAAGMTTVALSGDGRRAATGHLDGTIRVWDVPTGRTTATLAVQQIPLPGTLTKLNPYAITSLTMSPDGGLLLAAGKDLRLTLWDLRTNEVRHRLVGHQNSAYAAAISPDGRTAVSTGWSWEMHGWDLQTREQIWVRPPQRPARGIANHVSFLPDGNRVAVVLLRDGVALVNARTGVTEATFGGPEYRSVTCGATGIDPDLLALGDRTGGVRLASIRAHAVTTVLGGHRGETRHVAFSPDGRQLISTGTDGLVRFWDVHTGRQSAALPVTQSGQQAMALSGDGRLLAVVEEDVARVRGLSTTRGESRTAGISGDHPWHSCAISPRGRMAAVIGGGGVQVLDLATGCVLRGATLAIVRGPFDAQFIPIRFTPDDAAVVFGDDQSVWTLDLVSGSLTQTDTRARGRVVGISEDAATIAFVDGRGTSIVDRRTLAERHRVPTTQPLIRVDLMSQGRALLTLDATRTEKFPFFPSWVAYAGHRLSLWDLALHRELGSVEVERASTSATSLVPDGNRALVAVGGGGPAVIDPQAGVRLTRLEAAGGEVIAAALTHHGRTAVGVGNDRSVRFWDVRSGETLAVHDGPEVDADALAASDDGRWLVIAGNEPTQASQGWTFIRDMRLHESFAALEPLTAGLVSPAAPAQRGGAAVATQGTSTRPAHRLGSAWLGEWYVAQGFPDWAATSPAGADEPREASLPFARASWLANHLSAAAAEFDRLSARAGDPIEAAYLRLCAAACRAGVKE